jgi:hypothetical protein
VCYDEGILACDLSILKPSTGVARTIEIPYQKHSSINFVLSAKNQQVKSAFILLTLVLEIK